MKVMAKVVCMDCGAELGEKEIECPSGMEPVTHGFCDSCFGKRMAEVEESRRNNRDILL